MSDNKGDTHFFCGVVTLNGDEINIKECKMNGKFTTLMLLKFIDSVGSEHLALELDGKPITSLHNTMSKITDE